MLNTAAWPELQLPVLAGIHLDPRNVRLETANAQVEADILEDLFANEGVLGLVENISKVGYLTHETPIVIKRRGKYVVVEGNRRVAALKAIQNPMLVPDYKARVAAFSKNIPNIESLATIRAMVAPNQELANQLIAAIHTGNLRKPWSPARQAAFFQTQIDAGRKYKELLQRYPTVDVRRFVFRAHVVNLFQNILYDDPEIKDYLKTKGWRKALSTLSRIYESKDFLEITGLQMNDQGVVDKTMSDDALKAVATIIIQGIIAGDLNTRSLGTIKSPRFTGLMSELRNAVISAPESKSGAAPSSSASSETDPSTAGTPHAAGSSSSSPDSNGNQSTEHSSKVGPNSPPPAKKKGKVRYLPIQHLVTPTQYPVAIRLHLEELATLDIQKYPNMAFLMFRALLEKSIKAYAEAKQQDIKSSGNKSSTGYVQLHHALKWFYEYLTQNGPRPLIQPVIQLQSGKLINYTTSKNALDAINHNHHFHVDPDEVINCWNSIDSILRELMKP